jgi:hypothetical protein
MDKDGTLLYSDEINHSVVCLDHRGCLRWHKTGLGTDPGQMYYPKGLSLGWIRRGEEITHCLAVCDSWNRRIQFLDLDGNRLDAWTNAGGISFAEVTDVRLIPGNLNQEREVKPWSYWLVLDKGNHRLCALNHEGKLIFQVGRCVPPALERRWAVPSLFLDRDAPCTAFVKDFPPFDFTYYPERILGDSENALYLWESYSRRLKQVLLASLMPIHVGSADIDWISADISGLTGWRRKDGCLMRYDDLGDLLQEIEIQGTPIPSNLHLNEFWVQNGNKLEWWQWSGSSEAEEQRPCRIHSPLLRSALTEISLLNTGETLRAIAVWVALLEDGLALADSVLAMAQGEIDVEGLTRASESLCKLSEWRTNAQADVYETLHHWCLGLLECHLLGSTADEPARHIAGARDQWDVLAAPIRQKFTEIQSRIDDSYMLRLHLPKVTSGDRSLVEKWVQTAQTMEADFQQTLEWVYSWHGIVEGGSHLLPLSWHLPVSEGSPEVPRPPGHMVYRQRHQGPKEASRCLNEVARILVGREDDPGNPHGLACSPEGDLFVTLGFRHQVLHLDRGDIVIESIGSPGRGAGEFQKPACLALDRNRRLWVGDLGNNRIQIFDLERGTAEILGSFGSEPGQLIAPSGICASADGSMLVADAGNQRIIRITPERRCEIFSDRVGKGRGEFRCPSDLCLGRQGDLWIVDCRNHRIQKLDAGGRWVLEIGRCGLDNGSLYFPESVAEFDDGVVAVAQNQWNRCVKLFSPTGEELGKMALDYDAGGMAIRSERLLVAARDGDSIRVYERTHF